MVTTARQALAALALGMVFAATPAAAQDLTAGDWKFRAQIYGWFPTLSSETTFPASSGGGSMSLDAGDYLDHLRFVFMGTFEARKGKLGLLTDYIYLDFDAEKGGTRDLSFSGPGGLINLPVGADAGVNLRLRGWAWGLAGTYAAVEKPNYEMQLLGGVRYLKIDTTVDWRLTGNVGSLPPFAVNGAATVKDSVWDAIIGAKGVVKLGEGNWFAPYYVDVGTGQSDFTWQAMAGVGYKFSWGELIGAYRYLDYKFGQDTGMKALSFGGPAVSLGFRW
ncbi:MAG TPA: hypothetical protein VFN64_01470 [Burkholderiaceae bacterium]|nr:hypothetical protein [Burkholderiaceae bacterium]